MNLSKFNIGIALLFICFSQFSWGQYNTKVVLTDVNNESLQSKMELNATNFLTALNNAFAKKNKPKFTEGTATPDAILSVLTMWEMSSFRCNTPDIIERVLAKKNKNNAIVGYEVRNVPLFMAEAKKDEQYQELVLVFNNQGEIDNIYISIETNRYMQIISEGNDVTELRRRQIIVDFVENFKTAYNRKDINLLNKVFSDDALIITGKVVKVNTSNSEFANKFLNAEIIKYQKQTKEEYITKLKSIFKTNSYINVKFDDLDVKRSRKYDVLYGVNMVQTWNTSKYSDEGYLFLLIDFSDEDNPQINIRTWQPTKIGAKSLNESEKFKIEDFPMKM